MAAGLTEQQKIFVNEYLVDLNATRAYKAAYKNCKKENAAGAAANRLLKNVKIQEYIQKRMKAREIRTEITQDMVLNELAAIAFSDATEFAKVIETPETIITEDGTCTTVRDKSGNPVMHRIVQVELTEGIDQRKKKAISSIKHGKNGIEVATCDKVRALELLGRHLGMFKDKVEVSGMEEEKSKLSEILNQMRK